MSIENRVQVFLCILYCEMLFVEFQIKYTTYLQLYRSK